MNKVEPSPKNVTPAQRTAPKEESQPKQRTLGLSVLLIFSFVYSGLLLLLFIAGLFYPENVQSILQQYYKQIYISPAISSIANAAAIIIIGISFYGLVLLWKFKRKGFYYFASSQVSIILTIIFLLKSLDWINVVILATILFIIGINSKEMN